MHLNLLVCLSVVSSAHGFRAIGQRAPMRIAATDHVVELSAQPFAPNLVPPSSKHLAQYRQNLARRARSRQDDSAAGFQEDLLTIGGRIYIANVTISGQTFALVIDTGSSDTWVANFSFQCLDRFSLLPIRKAICGFGPQYDAGASSTFSPINYPFRVDYTGGEFLRGGMGTDDFRLGEVSQGRSPNPLIRQTIGVVNEGFWFGDGISSGLMGLAFPALAKGINNRALNYTSVIITLLKDPSNPPVFSLALSRPTLARPQAGGYLAIGGIPRIPYDGVWVRVPIQPVVQNLYAFYSINIDGFSITPPASARSSRPPREKRFSVRHTITNLFRSSGSESDSEGAPEDGQAQHRRQSTRPDYSKYKASMIIDSGSSLMYFPDDIVAYIASLFRPAARYITQTNTYVVSCNALAPRVGVTIGGRTFYIYTDDLMNRGPGAVGGSQFGAVKGECVLAVQPAQGGMLVLGDTWMTNVLLVFDLTNGRDIGVGGSDANRDGGGFINIAGRERY